MDRKEELMRELGYSKPIAPQPDKEDKKLPDVIEEEEEDQYYEDSPNQMSFLKKGIWVGSGRWRTKLNIGAIVMLVGFIVFMALVLYLKSIGSTPGG